MTDAVEAALTYVSFFSTEEVVQDLFLTREQILALLMMLKTYKDTSSTVIKTIRMILHDFSRRDAFR